MTYLVEIADPLLCPAICGDLQRPGPRHTERETTVSHRSLELAAEVLKAIHRLGDEEHVVRKRQVVDAWAPPTTLPISRSSDANAQSTAQSHPPPGSASRGR